MDQKIQYVSMVDNNESKIQIWKNKVTSEYYWKENIQMVSEIILQNTAEPNTGNGFKILIFFYKYN